MNYLSSILILLYSVNVDISESKTVSHDIWINEDKNNHDIVTKYSWGHNITDEEDLSFPGENDEKKIKLKAKWEEHYECLEKYHRERYKTKNAYAKSMMVFRGESVLLTCHLCISPQEVGALRWKYSKNSTHVNWQSFKYTRDMILYDNGYLHIYHVKNNMEGIFKCTLGSTSDDPIIIEVVDDDEVPLEPVRPKTAARGKNAGPNVTVASLKLNIYTNWSPWSLCSSCATVGIKYRIGVCYVEIIQGKVTRRFTEKMSLYHLQLKRFQNGLPCTSKFLPKRVKKLHKVKNRTSEIMTALCEGKRESDAEIENHVGNVLILTQNNIGSFGRLKEIPLTIPKPGRKLILVKSGEAVEIACPGHILSDVTIRWRAGNNKTILRENIFLDTENRVQITARQKIIIRNAQVRDGDIYSCWKLGDLAGSVKLVVAPHTEVSISKFYMVGVVILAGSFLICLLRIFRMNRRLKKNNQKIE